MKRYTRRKSYKVKILFSLLFLIILCMMAGKVLNSDFTLLPLDNITHHVASEDNGWNLILVNRNSYIPDDYKVELTELSNGEKVDSRIYPELQEMFNDARAQGYGLFVREGYRTQEEQQQLLDEKIEAYENEGKSKSEAKKLAEQWVAIPGTSEHQLGIAVDINADTTKSSSDDVYSWLAENAHKYGKWAGICGELGADLELTDEFMKMGVDELSVAPGMILKLRKRICEFSKN